MSIDLLYTAHNRLEFVRETFAALAANTNWELVQHLHILDDRSRDGTYEYLSAAIRDAPCPSTLTSSHFGGSVAGLNHALDRTTADVIAKCDNDLVVCPGWLEHMLATLNANPQIDALGIEPGFASFVAPLDVARTAQPAPHIGGIGLFRTRVFTKRRPSQHGRFFGLTEFQRRYCRAAWMDPDLPCFLLDHLPFEPWQSLTRSYVEKGWQRDVVGAPYTAEQAPYYDWWVRDRVAVA